MSSAQVLRPNEHNVCMYVCSGSLGAPARAPARRSGRRHYDGQRGGQPYARLVEICHSSIFEPSSRAIDIRSIGPLSEWCDRAKVLKGTIDTPYVRDYQISSATEIASLFLQYKLHLSSHSTFIRHRMIRIASDPTTHVISNVIGTNGRRVPTTTPTTLHAS
eukprot:COSAG06_NODE_13318_length_1269_cov_0.660684_2_plen_162_part_00